MTDFGEALRRKVTEVIKNSVVNDDGWDDCADAAIRAVLDAIEEPMWGMLLAAEEQEGVVVAGNPYGGVWRAMHAALKREAFDER